MVFQQYQLDRGTELTNILTKIFAKLGAECNFGPVEMFIGTSTAMLHLLDEFDDTDHQAELLLEFVATAMETHPAAFSAMLDRISFDTRGAGNV